MELADLLGGVYDGQDRTVCGRSSKRSAWALAAGAVEHSPVREDQYEMAGPCPIRRILQGAIVDPFGHMWFIGKIIE